MSFRRIIAAAAVLLLVALTMPGNPTVAAFSVTTDSQANAFGAASVGERAA